MFTYPLSQNLIRYPRTFKHIVCHYIPADLQCWYIKEFPKKKTNPYLRIINIKYNLKMIVMSRMPFAVSVLILKTNR